MRAFLFFLIASFASSAEGIQNWYFDFMEGKTTTAVIDTLPNGATQKSKIKSEGSYNKDKTIFTITGVVTYPNKRKFNYEYTTVWKTSKDGEIVSKITLSTGLRAVGYLTLGEGNTASLRGRALGRTDSRTGTASLDPKTKKITMRHSYVRDKKEFLKTELIISKAN